MTSSAFGPFQIGSLLGEGGFSAVYEAYDPQLGRKVALKLIHPHIVFTTEGQQRFLREVEAARRLQHRHIVRVLQAGFYEGRGFVTMELMSGGTLHQFEQSQKTINPQTTARVVRHVARGLDYAHRRGIIHRDVKPSNIFFRQDRVVCLGDFGMAKVQGMSPITRSSDVIGTLQYMSPEQVRGLVHMTAASDIYSLGVVLYEMVTGRRPFDHPSQAALLHAIVHTPPPRPRDVNASVTPQVERVLLQALSKDPARRFSQASQLAAAYQAALERDHVFISPPVSPRKNARSNVKAGAQPAPARPHHRDTLQRPGFWLFLLALLAFLLFLSTRIP